MKPTDSDLTSQELTERIKKLEEKLKESKQVDIPMSKGRFPSYGKVYPAFNKENILEDARKQELNIRNKKIPLQINSMAVTATSVTRNGRTYSNQEVTYILGDVENTKTVRIWMKGYNTANELASADLGEALGSQPWTLACEVAATGVAEFLTEATTEEVVIGVQPVNGEGVGADIRYMKQQQLTLI